MGFVSLHGVLHYSHMPTTSDTSIFDEQYRRLNPQQRQAVDTVDGPVMVFAGPGTGKTQILSLRIANIVRTTDTPADAILALTFTESAAGNMRKRLARMMGSHAYEVHVHTFHGLAQKLITEHPESFPRIMGSQLATDVDKLRIVESLLRSHMGVYIRWYDSYTAYVDGVLSAIDTLKREHISPAQLLRHVTDAQTDFDRIDDLHHEKGVHKGKMKSDYVNLKKQIEKNLELVSLYERFDAAMREAKLYDFTDMITELVNVCESDPEFLLGLQEEYQYILVDEYQDTNNVQNRIVELVGSFHDNPNIFVVGDDKQSVYRFQGASPEYFYGFHAKYPNATIIHLSSNYRSNQSVLDIAHALLPGPVQLQSYAERQPVQAQLSIYPDTGSELYGVVQGVSSLIQAGTPAEEIAVLTRTNTDGAIIASELSRAGISNCLESDIDILQSPIIRHIIATFQVIKDPHNNVALSRMLYTPWCTIPSIDVARIVRSSSQKKTTTMVDLLSDGLELKKVGVTKPKLCMTFADRIMNWHVSAQIDHASVVFQSVIDGLGIFNYLQSNQLASDIAALQVLFNDVVGFVHTSEGGTFREYVEYLDTLESHGKKLKLTVQGGRTGSVRIMTAHRSKGLEFDHVYIPMLVDGKWGNRPNRDVIKILDRVFDGVPGNESNGDERRLLFVALTRARSALHLSYAERSGEGRELVPSQFISQLDANHITSVDVSDLVEQYQTDLLQRQLAVPSITTDTQKEFHEYILSLFESRPIAATHLNNFLADPWEYICKNLIRIPELQSANLMYGTAVHYAIEQLYKSASQGEVLNSEGFVQVFRTRLGREPVADADYLRLCAQAERTLPLWYQEHDGIWETRGFSEFRINGVVLPSADVTLSGALDRFEFVGNSDSRVRVIDFKTGKSKSRNDIIGATKTSDGNYYRQLQFYKLLLRYFREGAYQLDDAVLHFVEPKESGQFVVERFTIDEAEIDELELFLQHMAQYIRSGEYWQHAPDPKKCNFIQLVDKIRNG